MQAIEGYFEDDHFHPSGKWPPVQGRRRAIVTILDEPARTTVAAKSANARAWHEFLRDIKTVHDEPLEEFERVKFREREI